MLKKKEILISNLEMLQFMDYDKVNIDEFNDDIYSTFFNYFEKSMVYMQFKKNKNKCKFPFSLWSYFEKINSMKFLN